MQYHEDISMDQMGVSIQVQRNSYYPGDSIFMDIFANSESQSLYFWLIQVEFDTDLVQLAGFEKVKHF